MKNKQEKIKELLDRLDTLEGKEVLPSEMDKITDSYIKEEVSNMQAKLKDNPTLKILQKFGGELEKFKKDFDLKPIKEILNDILDFLPSNKSYNRVIQVQHIHAMSALFFDFPIDIIGKFETFKDDWEKIIAPTYHLVKPFDYKDGDKETSIQHPNRNSSNDNIKKK